MSQQNEAFKSVKSYYDYQRQLLQSEFVKRIDVGSEFEKSALRNQYAEFMVRLDSIQNTAYVGALIKVKNEEDLKLVFRNNEPFQSADKSKEFEGKAPEYPGGINKLRTQVADLFYFDSSSDEKLLKAQVTFIVESEGHISNVLATGGNQNFNRQAVIAVYLLPEKFKPATINGQPVRYRYTLPLTMNFE